MHVVGLKEDLAEISACTSEFIWLFRASPFLGTSAFRINRRRSSPDVCFVEDEVATADGANTALSETILLHARVGGCNLFLIATLLLVGWTKQYIPGQSAATSTSSNCIMVDVNIVCIIGQPIRVSKRIQLPLMLDERW